MTCHPCTKKWKQYYISKGFNQKQAEEMARKIVMRVEARQRKERNKLLYLRAKGLLFKWTFIVNVKATILQSFLHHRLLWIGRSYNPDYPLACTGTCTTGACPYQTLDCGTTADCEVTNPTCSMGTCGCPAPLAHSSQVSNNCTCISGGVQCSGCMAHICTKASYTCSCGSTCGYNCDSGYVWNGSACVLAAVAKEFHGDGFTCWD